MIVKSVRVCVSACVCVINHSAPDAIQTWCSKNEIGRQEFCQLCFYSHKQKGPAVQRVFNIHRQRMPLKKKNNREWKKKKQTEKVPANFTLMGKYFTLSTLLKKSQSSRLTHGHTKRKNGGAEARGKRDVRQSKKTKQKKKQVRTPLFVFHEKNLHCVLFPLYRNTSASDVCAEKQPFIETLFNKHLSRSHSSPRVNIAQPKTSQSR